jgi:hypothetical protein
MPLDTTIPLQASDSIPNPFQQMQGNLQMMQGLQSLQNSQIANQQGLLALRQNQMRLGANQAISQAYQQALNPDGSVDFNKMQALAAQSGAGAFLPEFMSQLATQRNQQQQYDTSKLDMALKQQQGIRGMIGSLAVDPDLGKTDMSRKIAAQISQAVSSGILPIDQGVNEMRSIPSDPGAQAQWIQNHLINSLSGEAKIQALMPKQLTINRGGETDVLNVDPLTGRLTVSGALANSLTPGEAAQRISAVGPGGVPGTIPLGSTVPGAQGGYTGRYSQQGGAGADGTPAGFVATGLSPAQQAASTAQGSTSNAAAQTLHDAAADAPMRINLLNTARDALANITTAPGKDWQNTLASALNATPVLGDALRAMGAVDPTKIRDFDEFKKILTNYASSVSGSLGTGTDARLNAAVTGNANPGISKLANEDILTKTIAAEKMRAAQDYAFQNSGLTTDKFNQWQSQWNKNVNPDAFVFTSMSPTQQQAFLKRQSPQQLTQFKSDLGKLVRAGIIQMPEQ